MKPTAYPVVWTQGLLMTPQHMQQAAAYHDTRLEARLAAVGPWYWGVWSLELDSTALAARRVVIPSAHMILPSGLTLQWSATVGDPPVSRSLPDAPLPTHECVDVYLAVAHQREGVANVAAEHAAAPQQRFTTLQRNVAELTQAQTPAVNVEFAKPHAQVLFAAELTPEMESIKVAEIVLAATGELCFAPSYIPPCVRLGAAPGMAASLRRLLEALVARERAVWRLCQRRAAAPQALMAADALQFQRLAGLRAALPLVQDLVLNAACTPREAYFVLRQSVGLIAEVNVEFWPRIAALPPFEMTDLRRTFSHLFDLLHVCLDGSHEPQQTLHFSRGDAATWNCALPPALVEQATQWFIAVQGGERHTDWVASWPKRVKVAAPDDLPQLVKAAAAGIALTHHDRPPAPLQRHPDAVYFALDTQHPSWKRACTAGALALLIPASTHGKQPVDIDLMAVLAAAHQHDG